MSIVILSEIISTNPMQANIEGISAKTSPRAFENVRVERPITVIREATLPGIDGIEICRHFVSPTARNQIPVNILDSEAPPNGRTVSFATVFNLDITRRPPDRK